MLDIAHSPTAGARNLLTECLSASTGQSLIVLNEDPGLAFYDDQAPRVVTEVARDMGLRVETRQVGFSPDCTQVDDALWDHICSFDHAVFFARLGDQFRLAGKKGPNTTCVIMYTLDADMLGSAYGQVSHSAMAELKVLTDKAILRTRDIRITSADGTDLSGRFTPQPTDGVTATGFGIREFPVPVARAITATPLSGTLTLAHNLAGSGNRYFSPWGVNFEGKITADLDKGRISNLRGPDASVKTVTEYIEHVGRTFEFDPWTAQTWHAGIHPGCSYHQPAAENLERWVTGPFANPRAFHFHCGGDEFPGEINWHVLDVTICLDGVKVWEDGVFHPERLPEGRALLEQHEDLRLALSEPATEIGL